MKKFVSLTLSLALAASLTVPAFAAETVTAVPISAPLTYAYEITVNGVKLDTSKLPMADENYIPLRAVAESDHGSAYWSEDENTGSFYFGGFNVNVSFADNSITVGENTLEADAIVKNGVTYVPVSAFDGAEGYTVTVSDNKIDIVTPNNAPLIKLSYSIIDEIQMSSSFKNSADDLKSAFQMDTSIYSDIAAFSSMMIRSDTLFIGHVTNKSDIAKAEKDFEARRAAVQASFEQYLPGPLELAKNGKVVTEGNYVMLVISEDNDKAIEMFKAFVAEQK